MRQAPKYALIGSGRVANHFKHYFNLIGIKYSSWSRKNNSYPELEKVLSHASHILILINDKAIEEFIIANKNSLKNKTLIHFSGSLTTELAFGMHPLMTFNDSLYDLETYKQIPFIIEENVDFFKIFPDLLNINYKISKSNKSFYHSLCVLSGNFTCILWDKLFSEMEKTLSIPKELAYPYLNRVCNNLQEKDFKALTGPLVRNDELTILSNLKALDNDPFQEIYQAFVNVFKNK